jgi:type IV pilus biogenesis protein CpaD/CtpE
MTAFLADRRFILLGLAALPLAACAEPRAQQVIVDETRPPRRVVDPKTELERGTRR